MKARSDEDTPRSEVAYLLLFPAATRRRLLRLRRVRFSNASDWIYLVQELGSACYELLKPVVVYYLIEYLKSKKRCQSFAVHDVLERTSDDHMTRYKRIVRKSELAAASGKGCPKYVISIIDRHRKLVHAFDDSIDADTLLAPVIEKAVTDHRSEVFEILSKYEPNR